LVGKASKRVAACLDLETFQMPVEKGDICTYVSVRKQELVNYQVVPSGLSAKARLEQRAKLMVVCNGMHKDEIFSV